MQIHRQSRWVYNAALNIAYWQYEDLIEQRKISETALRDLVQHYRYLETPGENGIVWKELKYDPDYRGWPTFPGEQLLHSRVARGAVLSFARALNAALSNFRAGNIRHFNMNYRSEKRSSTYTTLFEDANFPREILNLHSTYCYTETSKGRNKRSSVSFREIFEQDQNPSGFTLEYDTLTDKHYILYTVPANWFPESDRRSDNQATANTISENSIIALDPGVRTFLTGYDPAGRVVSIAEGSNKRLYRLLYRIDKVRSGLVKEQGNRKVLLSLNRKVRNLCSELHWKSARFLSQNYRTIVLPHFRTSELLRGKKLSKLTKRCLQAFSFFQFKARLAYKCRIAGSSLVLVEEDYTSKTCGSCGKLKSDLGSNKIFACRHCGVELDRDENGARNILLKNLAVVTA